MWKLTKLYHGQMVKNDADNNYANHLLFWNRFPSLSSAEVGNNVNEKTVIDWFSFLYSKVQMVYVQIL